jgi:hypothetical protein
MNKLSTSIDDYLDHGKYKEISLDDIPKDIFEDVVHVSMWLDKDIDDLKFYLKNESIDKFEGVISDLSFCYELFESDKEKSVEIYKILKDNKNKLLPVFIEYGDEDNFIIEGNSRLVAYKWLDFNYIPVIYVK